jgi:hypothetical protein
MDLLCQLQLVHHVLVIPITQIQQYSIYQVEVVAEAEVHHMYDPNVSIVWSHVPSIILSQLVKQSSESGTVIALMLQDKHDVQQKLSRVVDQEAEDQEAEAAAVFEYVVTEYSDLVLAKSVMSSVHHGVYHAR